jgi:outer membrane protein TolC
MLRRDPATRLIRNRSMATVGLLSFVLSVSGCAVGPDFETPGAVVQDNWIEKRDARVETKRDVKCAWWRVFKDPTLDELIERASEQNLPVQIAGLRILEARAQLGVAIGKMYPQDQEGFGVHKP